MIVITAAMPFETSWISSQLIRPRHAAVGKFTALQGRLCASNVLIFHLGAGKTNAAHGTTLLLENFSPTLILLIGCGGAYRRSGLIPGDLAVATEEIFGDEGVITPQGWRSTKYLKLPLLRKGDQIYYNTFPIDQKVLNKAQEILKRFKPGTGPFVTVSEVTGTQEKADEMENRFRGICENMEGASVAQLCTFYETPFLEIRGISNVVKRRNKKEWDLSAATRVSQKAAREIITHWRGAP
ncbi:MAG: futalosine hydrolase [Nitrospirae bacterium]|nr:futalosine hydrolase [Nitrospirota bacterium]